MTVEAENQVSEPAQTFFKDLLGGAAGEGFDCRPEDFVPHPGTMLVRPDSPEQQSEGGIHLPDIAQKDRRTGVIVTVTPPLDAVDREFYKPGNRILFRLPANDAHIHFRGQGVFVILQYCGSIDDEVLGRFDTRENV